MLSISTTQLFSLLSEKVGTDTAEKLATYIEQKIEKEVDSNTKHLATKEDLEKGFKEQARWMLGICITLVIMILGLYATILFKK